MARRVLLIGLDCAPPELVFDQLRPVLPNLSRLIDNGVWGPLESSIPAITVPAWMTGMTSKDPGELGIYGFRNRADRSYDKLSMATSLLIHEETVWDILGQAGKRSIVVAVPPAFPPKPINGSMVGCFLTPSIHSQYTYPPSLREEIAQLVGDYMVDVENFRTDDKEYIRRSCHEMTEKRFKVIRHLMQNRDWDLFAFVEIGPDRMHHGLWSDHDPAHPRHNPDSPFRWAIRDYYRMLDDQIGSLLELVGPETAVIVASDHGAKPMDGGICINEWLVQQGLLHFSTTPSTVTPFAKLPVDWGKTIAWGDGGHYGRLFMNVQGREPEGTVAPADYERVRDEIAEGFRSITAPDGQPLGTVVYKPEEIYRTVNGVAPDLIVYWGDLDWRSVGSLGHGSIYTFENDTGPDESNHARHGIFVLHDGGVARGGPTPGLRLLDLAPTVLHLLGQPIPADMQGRSIADPSCTPGLRGGV
ncbi:MAG: alkaline phosphatase family protein, partial [Chloroflexi bacterium]|nr:alkaline phosphatase family protein [Chloroflexota bacterium]